MKIAFWGNFGTDNLGNECTLHAALAAAHRHVAGTEIFAVCSNPADTVARHHIEAVRIAPPLSTARLPHPRPVRLLRRLAAELRDWARVVGTMRATDALVMTGTGMLTDKHEGLFGLPYQMAKWASAARLWRKDVLFASVGVEELTNPLKRRLMGSALRRARYRSYRDPASRKRASGLLAASKRDPIFPDLAFSLPRSLTAERGGSPPDTATVALGVCDAVETSVMPAYVEALGDFALRLLDRGIRIRLVIGDARYDPPVRERLRSWLRERRADNRVIIEPITSFQELIRQLTDTEFVVATRFHNLMAAAGLSEYRMPLKDVEPGRLLETFERMERNADELRRRIEDRVETWREELEEQYAIMFRSQPNPGPREDGA
jgi:polysaccharide pyruvyl transferase WcaK-like protein